MTTLRRGSKGPDVVTLQRALCAQDYAVGTPDGDFGPRTEAAVRMWQTAHGLFPDGIYGPASALVMAEVVARASPSQPPTPRNPVHEQSTLPDPPPKPGETDSPCAVSFIKARNFRVVGGIRTVRLVVLHTTEGGGTARAVAAWFASSAAPQASSHYVVDAGEAVQGVRESDVAWAAPGANNDGIQIEQLAWAKWTPEEWASESAQAMLERSAELVADICRRRAIPVVMLGAVALLSGQSGITTHRAVSLAYKKSNHTDPGPNFPTEDYLSRVRHHLGKGGGA